MTDMPACLGGAALELETHFSLLKINTSHSPPSWFSRGNTHPKKNTNKGERNNAHTAWTAAGDCHYFRQQLWQNCTSVSFWAAPYVTFSSQSGNIWITREWFLFPQKEKCSFRNDLLVILLRDSSSNYRAIVVFLGPSLPWWWCESSQKCRSRSDCFEFGFFVREIHSLRLKRRTSAAFCCHRLCIQSRHLLWQANLGDIIAGPFGRVCVW